MAQVLLLVFICFICPVKPDNDSQPTPPSIQPLLDEFADVQGNIETNLERRPALPRTLIFVPLKSIYSGKEESYPSLFI
jgi:hypothetical protein